MEIYNLIIGGYYLLNLFLRITDFTKGYQIVRPSHAATVLAAYTIFAFMFVTMAPALTWQMAVLGIWGVLVIVSTFVSIGTRVELGPGFAAWTVLTSLILTALGLTA